MALTLLRIGVVLLVTVPMATAALVGIPFDPRGRFLHGVARNWGKVILWVFGITVHLKGKEFLEAGKNYVYVSNHASMFDIPAVLAAIPDEIRLVLKKELTRIPIWGWALRYGAYITIDRSNPKDAMKSLDEAAEKIRKGASVLLFAEGTRTRDGKLQAFKRGAFAIAARSGVPIIPLTINNSFRILPKGSLRVQAQDIEMILDKPIPTGRVDGRDDELKLMEKVHAVIAGHFVEQS